MHTAAAMRDLAGAVPPDASGSFTERGARPGPQSGGYWNGAGAGSAHAVVCVPARNGRGGCPWPSTRTINFVGPSLVSGKGEQRRCFFPRRIRAFFFFAERIV